MDSKSERGIRNCEIDYYSLIAMAKLNPWIIFDDSSCLLLEACNTGLVKNGDIAVLVAIAKFADNDSKVCWPSIQKICETIGISRPTVISALERLTQAGLIEIVTPPNHGKGKATKRRLVFSEPSNSSSSRKHQASHSEGCFREGEYSYRQNSGVKIFRGIKKKHPYVVKVVYMRSKEFLP